VSSRGSSSAGWRYQSSAGSRAKTDYFFYLTNDRKSTAEKVVFEANGRGNQENLIGQLRSGAHALKVPLDNLLSNWVYMVIGSLAWRYNIFRFSWGFCWRATMATP
jgi:hypothetical protein